MKVVTSAGVTDIRLSGAEVAQAIDLYIKARHVHVAGDRKTTVNGGPIIGASVLVGATGKVLTRARDWVKDTA